eukprot:CAMPEP_0202922388 /NCGR_PEP_ID=MMETSP1392-20130828/77897_1 /ASSEMBLY_ACC=CAM_ASM_000868 /TAXON_ID=225041 /ORGANISM="Chlamydomonas chlamydogama, Strain SAG 11-48b" /LENGTH=84 /DNA_ID=CAMNT_0049616011 /DNA_START=742 /DNA_END=997 /DNA_ORIENTATION=+
MARERGAMPDSAVEIVEGSHIVQQQQLGASVMLDPLQQLTCADECRQHLKAAVAAQQVEALQAALEPLIMLLLRGVVRGQGGLH